MKTCVKCGTLFEGRYCKVCKKAIGAAYYAKNREAHMKKTNAWRDAHPEAVKAIRAAAHARDPEKARARQAAWRAANPDKVRQYSAMAYARADKQKRKSIIAEWHKKNPRARGIHEHNRRARASGKLSPDLPQKLFALQKGKCACCKRPLGKDYHLDHILPLALGGENVDSNMQLLRALCNMQKHKKHPVDFMQQRGYLL